MDCLLLQLPDFVQHLIPERFCLAVDGDSLPEIPVPPQKKLLPRKGDLRQPQSPAPAHTPGPAGVVHRELFGISDLQTGAAHIGTTVLSSLSTIAPTAESSALQEFITAHNSLFPTFAPAQPVIAAVCGLVPGEPQNSQAAKPPACQIPKLISTDWSIACLNGLFHHVPLLPSAKSIVPP